MLYVTAFVLVLVTQCVLAFLASSTFREHVRALQLKWTSDTPIDSVQSQDLRRQLDDGVSSNEWLLSLKRITAMGPLLGIVLTVWDFLRMDPSILTLGEPLTPEQIAEIQAGFRGVVLGVSIALTNIVILTSLTFILVRERWRELRRLMAIRVNTSALERKVQESFAKALNVIRKEIGDVVGGMQKSADALDTAFQKVTRNLEATAVKYDEAANVYVNGVAQLLNDQTNQLAGTVTMVQEAAQRFDEEFDGTAKELSTHMNVLVDSIAVANKAAEPLQLQAEAVTSISNLSQTLKILPELLEQMQEILKRLGRPKKRRWPWSR